ncbi:hypothetical protein ACFV8Z_51280 [Streptomyces sp. NPDC059837]|uniref:hypothetical protein n=1 Tax=unclassified Streptomyces TaxID=2593676 RepID=UPI0036596999
MTFPVSRSGRRRIAWAAVAVSAIGTAVFSGANYLTGDASASRIPLNPDVAVHYLTIVVRGTVAVAESDAGQLGDALVGARDVRVGRHRQGARAGEQAAGQHPQLDPVRVGGGELVQGRVEAVAPAQSVRWRWIVGGGDIFQRRPALSQGRPPGRVSEPYLPIGLCGRLFARTSRVRAKPPSRSNRAITVDAGTCSAADRY